MNRWQVLSLCMAFLVSVVFPACRGAEPLRDGVFVGGSRSDPGVVHLKEKGPHRVWLRTVAEGDGAPIGGVVFAVIRRTKGGRKRIGWGRTGSDGTALVKSLPAGRLLFEATRRPPFAGGSSPIVLEDPVDSEVWVDLLLERGVTARGRVLDDAGDPIPGAEVLLRFRRSGAPRVGGARRAFVASREDGTFEFPAIRGRRLDSVRSPRLAARYRNRSSESVPVRTQGPEDFVDVGALVVPRASFYEGVVFDALTREPIKGALVSTRYQRDPAFSPRSYAADVCLPGEAGFRPTEGEGVTDSRGKFRVESTGFDTLIVLTPGGRNALTSELDSLLPGEIRSGIEVAVHRSSLLGLEFLDGEGMKLGIESLAAVAQRMPSYAPEPGFVEIGLLLRDGTAVYPRVFQRASGFAAEVNVPLDRVQRLEVAVPGYEPLIHDFASPPCDGQVLPFVLDPIPTFPLRLRLAFSGEGSRSLRIESRIVAPDAGPDPSGYGNEVSLEIDRPSPRLVALDTLNREAHWVRVRPRRWNRGMPVEKVFGPFEPGDRVYDVDLGDLGDFCIPDRRPPRPEQKSPRGIVRVRIVDRETGEIVREPRLTLRAGEESASEWFLLRLREECYEAQVPEGEWSFEISAEGYAPVSYGSRVIRAGRPLDLVTVRLSRLPQREVTVRRWDGRAYPAGTVARLRLKSGDGSGLPEFHVITLGDGGLGGFTSSLPPGSFFEAVLTVWPPGEPQGPEQRFRNLEWPEAGSLDLRLARTRPVEIVLTGLPDKHRRLSGWCWVEVQISGGEGDPQGTMDSEHCFPTRALWNRPGTLSYRARLPVGQFKVRYSSAFYEAEAELEVSDEKEPIEVSIPLVPRGDS